MATGSNVGIANFAAGELSAGITAAATSLTLRANQGQEFDTIPADGYYYLVIIDTNVTNPAIPKARIEIVKTTAKSTDTFSGLTRGLFGTTAKQFPITGGDDVVKVVVRLAHTTEQIRDLIHDYLEFTELGSDPDTPIAGNIKIFAGAAGTGSAIYGIDDAGKIITLAGGFEVLDDLDVTLTAKSPRTLVMTPTVERTITLPTLILKGGEPFTIVNGSNTVRLVVKSSDGDVLCRTIGGMITFLPIQDIPTDRLHWRRLGSAMDLLDTQEANASASLDFTGIDAAYDEYLFIFSKLRVATDGAGLYFRVSTDGGSTFKSGVSDYLNAGHEINETPTQTTIGGTLSRIVLVGNTTMGNLADEAASGEVKIFDPAGGNKPKFNAHGSARGTAAAFRYYSGSGQYVLDDVAVDAAQIIPSTGNLTSGRVSMYGIKR